MKKMVQIKSFKYPNHLHYEWEGELVMANDEFVLVHCLPKRSLVHHTKGKVFTMANETYEWFSLKEGFTAAMAVEDGKAVSYYCNVSKPSTFENGIVSFVDLDLDYLKRKNSDWQVVDEDEFVVNRVNYGYPEDLITYAENQLEQLKKRVKENQYPFNITKEKDINVG